MRQIRSFSATAVVTVIFGFCAACGPNESILRSNSHESPAANSPAAASTKVDTVESEVENMRTANFDFIIVIRRKDGQVLDTSDKAFVKVLISNANRRSLSGDGKAIIIGSNSLISGELIGSLRLRFDVDDLSMPDADLNTSNAAANANMVR